MAKAEKKEKVMKGAVKSGMQAKDLSTEKRVELFNKDFGEFTKNMSEQYGIGIDVEIISHPKGIVPRLVLKDLLVKPNGDQPQQAA